MSRKSACKDRSSLGCINRFVSARQLDLVYDRDKQEFTLRPTFLLDEQLKIMSRVNGASTVDGWFSEIGKFMAETGTVPTNPLPKGLHHR